MRKIQLSRGMFTRVDDEWYEYLSRYKWYAACQKDGRWYAVRAQPTDEAGGHNERGKIYMHRVIMNPPDGLIIDHADGDGLNNVKKNLRVCSYSDNSRNKTKGKRKGGTLSKYKGVTWHKRDNRWQASIGASGKLKFLGYFTTEKEAAMAYDKAARDLFGEFAKLNFS